MEIIDKYFSEVYYIASSFSDSRLSNELKYSLKVNLLKTMAIGATAAVLLRFSLHKRFYLFKNYVGSMFYGSLFGIMYSPYFLSRKIDQEMVFLMAEQEKQII